MMEKSSLNKSPVQLPNPRVKHRSGSMLEHSKIHKQLSMNSNAVSIDYLNCKKNIFVPFYPDLKSKQKNIDYPQNKFGYEISKYKKKKELEPHTKNKAYNSVVSELIKSESKTNNLRIAEIRESKHRKNITAVTKLAKDKKNPIFVSEQTKSFYIKPGERPIHYQLKMSILKYEQNKEQEEKRQHQRSQKKLLLHPKAKFLEHQMNQFENKSLLLSEKVRNKDILQSEKRCENSDGIEGVATNITTRKRRYIVKNESLNKSLMKSNKSVRQKKQPQQVGINGYTNVADLLNLDRNQQNTIELVKRDYLKHKSIYFESLQQNSSILQNKSAECASLLLYNKKTNQYTMLVHKKCDKRVQIASITKIMTCLLILNIARVFKLNIKEEKLLVSEKASKMPGTSALLAYSDNLTVFQALHGLMLPSGNDAAVALGNWGGKMIRKFCETITKINRIKSKEPKSASFPVEFVSEKISYQRLFISHMNKACRSLELSNTYFCNTHGLMNEKAYSTASDVAKLTAFAMKHPIFAQIVATKQFQCTVFNRMFSQNRKVSWKNTNKLLQHDGFIGAKTGVTPSAGPCLSSIYKLNDEELIIIVVLNVKSMQYRFKESLCILKQYLKLNNNSCNSIKFDDKLPLLHKNLSESELKIDLQVANMTNNQAEQPSQDDEDDEYS